VTRPIKTVILSILVSALTTTVFSIAQTHVRAATSMLLLVTLGLVIVYRDTLAIHALTQYVTFVTFQTRNRVTLTTALLFVCVLMDLAEVIAVEFLVFGVLSPQVIAFVMMAGEAQTATLHLTVASLVA
jgi:hypothetical protein